MELPTLDFGHAHPEANPELRAAFYKQLISALSYSGFVKIVNHGIGEDLIQEAFGWIRKFFALPKHVKTRAMGAENVRYRGFIPQGSESAINTYGFVDGENQAKLQRPDIKECYDFGSDADTFLPNCWLSEADFPGFHDFMNSLYQKTTTLRRQIFTVLEHALEIPAGRLTSLTDGDVSCMRLNWYPACEIKDLQNGAKRISDHQDSGDITLLFQDGTGGLEIEDRQHPGKYLAVPRTQGEEIILNIGDTLQRWTNGKLRSTSHRVVLPRELLEACEGQVEDRYSMTLFGKANRSAKVGSLPEFIAPGQRSKYEDITAWEYQKRKTVTLYA